MKTSLRYAKIVVLEFLLIYAVTFAVNAAFGWHQNLSAMAVSSLISAAIIAWFMIKLA